MGIFSSIKDAIFGKDEPAKKAPTGARSGANPGATPAGKPAPQTAPKTGNAWADAPVVERQSVDTVDVENHLDSMPGADRLNWRTSIVDLLKLINVDSDYASRKALATELGHADYEGSAEDNVWLHKRTMRELAAHGGKVPPEYLD
ncbi:MAG: DUF3597 domain-containing protein [Pseudomonadota bacterium]|nr:DUF3597 domain-containing protein [Pseudomonadota bacterium]